MTRIKTALDRCNQRLMNVAGVDMKRLRGRILRLGYDPSEVLKVLPPDIFVTRMRLLAFLEYEDQQEHGVGDGLSETEFVCLHHPEIMLQYLEYLLDQQCVPAREEITQIREHMIVHPELIDWYKKLERRWKTCLTRMKQ